MHDFPLVIISFIICTLLYALCIPKFDWNKSHYFYQYFELRGNKITINKAEIIYVTERSLSNDDEDDEDGAYWKMKLYFSNRNSRLSGSVRYANGSKKACHLNKLKHETTTFDYKRKYVDDAELDHFTLLFCRGQQRNVLRIITQVHSHCSFVPFVWWCSRGRCRCGLLKVTTVWCMTFYLTFCFTRYFIEKGLLLAI